MTEYYKKQRMRDLKGTEYVYKYIPLKFLKEIIKNKQLRIAKVSTWKDPYENFLLKNNFYTNIELYGNVQDVQVSTEEILERTYGQSWTICEESDAMWRIYSKYTQKVKTNTSSYSYLEEVAVRVKINAVNLFDIVYINDRCMATTSIGKVKYWSDDKINEFLDKMEQTIERNNINWNSDTIECLYIKRCPFEHEKEVRIIISHDTGQQKEEYLSYTINDMSVFEEFTLDPRLEDKEVTYITNELVNLGVKREKVTKSSLYHFTPRRIKI